MKKMLLATALALLIAGCARQTFTVQNKPAVAPKTITHHFFVFLELGRRKLSMQPEFGAKSIVKTETQQTFVNGLLGFITLGIYTPLEGACVLLTANYELPIDMGNSICTIINILPGFLPVVFA